MSMTRRQLEQLRQDRIRRLDLRRPQRRAAMAAWLTEREAVPRRWAAALALAWVGVYSGALAIQPRAADPSEPEPAWALLLFLALVVALSLTWYGLAGRLRLGLVASVVGAGVALASAVMCPVSGHHGAVGWWWYTQLAGFTALAGLGLLALRRSRGTGGASGG